MFTGIIEKVGIIDKVNRYTNLSTICIKAGKVVTSLNCGDSIAVDGVCLTVTNIKKNVLTFDVMKESLLKTSLGKTKVNDRVNLERALKFGDRLSGHFVTGHIDDVGKIKDIVHLKNYTEMRIGCRKPLKRYFVPKGSVCLDGVSLTIGDVKKDYFSVFLIPFTKKGTTLGGKKKGDFVNIETDILAKYLFKR